MGWAGSRWAALAAMTLVGCAALVGVDGDFSVSGSGSGGAAGSAGVPTGTVSGVGAGGGTGGSGATGGTGGSGAAAGSGGTQNTGGQVAGGAGGEGGLGAGGTGPTGCAALNPPDVPPSVCSGGGPSASATFINNCDTETVEVFWVDYSCVEVSYGTIAPTEQLSLGSYATHEWRFREVPSGRLLKEAGAVQPGGSVFTVP